MYSPIQRYLDQLVAEIPDEGGELASYIPELAAADPDGFAVCLATVDGKIYEVGDTSHEYSIQSISKPFTYALALEDRGADEVFSKIDVEPSGDPFNEISLDPKTGKPRNPPDQRRRNRGELPRQRH